MGHEGVGFLRTFLNGVPVLAVEVRADTLRQMYSGCPVCWPDPPELREILDLVIRVLPQGDARHLRRRVEELDDLMGDWHEP